MGAKAFSFTHCTKVLRTARYGRSERDPRRAPRILGWLSNLYLNELARMLERAREVTRNGNTPTSNMRGSRTIW